MSEPRRVAVVAGLRTPFDRQAGFFSGLSALDLARPLIPELLWQQAVRPEQLQLLIFGSVLPDVSAPNIARELINTSGLAASTEAWSLSRACTTSLQALSLAADQIRYGQVDIAIAGGSDSASKIPIQLNERLSQRLLAMRQAKGLAAKCRALRGWSWRELSLKTPSVRDYSTGLRMGDAAEQMARDWQISRQAQDEYALQSHHKALLAREQQRLDSQLMCFFSQDGRYLAEDRVMRQTQPSAYQKLKPAFDRRFGTVTAANSCALTDGAAALLLMSEAEVERRGVQPLGWLVAASQVALEADRQMLYGPAYAIPKVLRAAGLSLQQMDLIEMHEAFAAQVLACTAQLADPAFSLEQGFDSPLQLDPQRLNVLGGSLAYGHPFAATGARLVMQGLHELRARQGRYLLVAACAAGGLGSAIILESL